MATDARVVPTTDAVLSLELFTLSVHAPIVVTSRKATDMEPLRVLGKRA